MMDPGVPQKPVAGIAMGSKGGDRFGVSSEFWAMKTIWANGFQSCRHGSGINPAADGIKITALRKEILQVALDRGRAADLFLGE
ncbi:MAG: hypothetical protein CM15mP21_5630 [Hyphomicrobiales bacterium]|nr:MAG: hypothetical protein CM15mP21_5630 [Hyphomicrobiales bacterium]